MTAIGKIRVLIFSFKALKAPLLSSLSTLEISTLRVNNQVLKFLMAKLRSANKA